MRGVQVRIDALTHRLWMPAARAADDAVGNHCLIPAIRRSRFAAGAQDHELQRRHHPEPLTLPAVQPRHIRGSKSTVDVDAKPTVDSLWVGVSMRVTYRGGVNWLPSNTPSLASNSPTRIQSLILAVTQQPAVAP